MSLKQVMDEKDPEERMLQLCGYLYVMDNSEVFPSREIAECVEALSKSGKKAGKERKSNG